MLTSNLSRAITTHLFSAAATLIIEAQLTGTANLDAVPDSVRRSCEFLRSIQAENQVSATALSILETMCATETHNIPNVQVGCVNTEEPQPFGG
jgi:hypothetical protein